MISDNGKAFEAAAKMIKEVISSSEVKQYFEGTGIEWRFNVPKAGEHSLKDSLDRLSVV